VNYASHQSDSADATRGSTDASLLSDIHIGDSNPDGHNNQLVQLRVTGGMQLGASMLLQVGQTYLLGPTLEHHIVVRDTGRSGLQLILGLDGLSVVHADELVRSQSGTQFTYGETIELGDSSIVLEPYVANSLEKNSVANSVLSGVSDRAANSLNGGVETGVSGVSIECSRWLAHTKTTGRFGPAAKRLLRVGGLSAIGFALLGAVLSNTEQESTTQTTSAVTLESRLFHANLSELAVEHINGNIVLSGYVATRDQAIQVSDFVARQPENLINRVRVDEEIKDHIKDVFRINGVTGSVDSLGQGMFVAQTNLASSEKIKQLQALIEKDVPSALSFKVVNVPPKPKPPASEQRAPKLDAGKRVVLVNSDHPAYVVTQDQSRYFIGSTLPGGYRISAISNGRVTVEKQGVKTELRF